MREVVCIIVALLLAAAVVPASADDVIERYTAAVKAGRAGEPQKAVADLEALLKEQPNHRLADDILYKIGWIYEREIYDYNRAVAFYARLVEEFPESKNARRAEATIRRLNKSRASGDVAFREYQAILLEYYRIGGAEALARMEKLMEAHPDFSLAEKAWLFIAQERMRLERYADGIAAYERIIESYDSDRNFVTALVAIGNAHIETRNIAEARAAYRRLAAEAADNRFAVLAAEKGLRRVRDFTVMRGGFYASAAVVAAYLVAMLAGIPWRRVSWSGLWQAWPETLVLSLIIFGAITGLRDRGQIFVRSLLILWPAAVAVVVCNGLFVQLRPASRRGLWVFALAALVVGAAMLYAVFYLTDLANLLWDSLAYEMEYGD
ncbi:MAG: tetratricopeptide repeat protein [Deltaproteobacteria bacterium]|nr:tetratricopeptide repeat protein [Deltaproteobacteria bacterium]